MMLLLALFIEYFKIGLFAIGGGMATIPFLTKLADKTHWFTQMDLLNMLPSQNRHQGLLASIRPPMWDSILMG